MAMMAMWARTAAGTNLPFVKGFGKALKSWKDVLQQTLYKKAHLKPKAHHDIPPQHGKERCIYQPTILSRPSDKLHSRIFRSLFSRSTKMTLANSLRSRVGMNLSLSAARNGPRGYRNVPLLSLIGVTMGLEVDQLIDRSHEKVMAEMKGMFQDYGWEAEPLPQPPGSLSDLDIEHSSIANGCEGAVYKAKMKGDNNGGVHEVQDEDFDLAVKAVFNYGTESNAGYIMRELHRETVPLSGRAAQDTGCASSVVGRLPSHPNIVDMPGMFVDDVLVTEEALKNFPAAMPRSVNPECCFGRSKTLYLVMRRRSSHLGEYLATQQVSMGTRCLILAQVLEGVSHLVHHGIAHRDLKANNILVATSKAGGPPKVEICDFGCCLAEESRSLKVAYPSRDLFIGGNSWLMAPEIANGQPGPHAVLDYSKSDAWAVGALAYEILGADNPFYPCRDNSRRQLSSLTYNAQDLPSLPEDVPGPVKRLVRALLARDPAKRPSASVAATVMHMVVMDTNSGKQNGRHIVKKKLPHSPHRANTVVAQMAWERDMFQRVLVQALSLLCQLTFAAGGGTAEACWDVPCILRFLFLSRLNYQDFRKALHFF